MVILVNFNKSIPMPSPPCFRTANIFLIASLKLKFPVSKENMSEIIKNLVIQTRDTERNVTMKTFPLHINFFLWLKADFQSVEFSERAEILLFAEENIALKLNR